MALRKELAEFNGMGNVYEGFVMEGLTVIRPWMLFMGGFLYIIICYFHRLPGKTED